MEDGVRIRRVLPIGLVATLLWLSGGAAHAVQLLSVADVTCGGLSVTGTGLPADTLLVLAVRQHPLGPAVRSLTVRTTAEGTARADVHASFAGFDEVSVAALDAAGRRTLVIASHQFARPCPAEQPVLPVTGAAQDRPWLLATGLGLVVVGIGVRARTAYRGTHA